MNAPKPDLEEIRTALRDETSPTYLTSGDYRSALDFLLGWAEVNDQVLKALSASVDHALRYRTKNVAAEHDVIADLQRQQRARHLELVLDRIDSGGAK